jgi:hypothetical protein
VNKTRRDWNSAPSGKIDIYSDRPYWPIYWFPYDMASEVTAVMPELSVAGFSKPITVPYFVENSLQFRSMFHS